MFVELTREEAQLLTKLIHTRLNAFETFGANDEDGLEQDHLRHRLERLEHRLHEAEWDVTC